MSDTPGKPKETEGQLGIEWPENNESIPHTGKFPEGHPFREEPPKKDDGTDKFKSTPLIQASSDHIVLPHDTSSLAREIDTRTADTNSAWYRRKPVKFAGAAVLGLAVLGIGAKLGSSNGSETLVATPDTTTTEDLDIQPDSTEPTTVETPADGEATVGNIDLFTLPLGDNPITAERPNGEMIEVPRLGGRTPNEMATSALSLFACYLTTGSEECMQAFSSNFDVQEALSAFRQEEIEPLLEHPLNKDMQVAVFDNSEDPATFTSTSDDFGRNIYELSGGTLYFGRYVDATGTNEWQSPKIQAKGILESKVNSIRFFIAEAGSDGLTVVRFEWDISATE